MPAYGEHARHRDSGGSRRRPRDAPTQYQHQQTQFQQQAQYQQQHAQYQQPHHGQQKRRDTADSNPLHASTSSQGSALKRPRVRFTPPLDAPLLSKVATMSGFLRKQADNEPGKWTKYYFVLKPTTYLYYYASATDAEPRGILDVEFLRDVRFNTDCVQRSVGGSKHVFRVTGQLPTALCAEGKDPNKTQFRPVYLDAESRDQADAWMEAIRHHRFDLERHRDYDDLLDSMDEVEEQLGALRGQAKEIATVAHRVLRKGKELVCAMRGVELDDVEDPGRPRGLSHQEEDVGATIQSIGVLLDELFSEADRHRRIAETLRQREGDAARENAQLKECEAELAIQATRSERLARELELLREDQRQQKQSYEVRYEELVARERHVLAREKEMLAQIKEREKMCDARMQEVDQKSSKWSKELEKEAARRNAELEKRRKALDKQQKALEQKQKLLDKRLQETAPSGKMRFVGAIGKSRATPKDEPVEEAAEEHQDHEEDEDATAPRGAKSRGRFMPGFLSRKAGAAGASHESGDVDLDGESEVPVPSVAKRAAPEPEIESDYFDARAELPSRDYHGSSRGGEYNADRSSDASTTRLSGVSYSSSVSTQYAPRSGRSLTTSAIPATTKRPTPSRSASVPAATSAVYNGMTVRLPPEWTYKESKKYQGRFYYYNRISGETRWEFPFDAVLDDEPASASALARVSHASSYDDGNDYVTPSQDEKEDISAFLSRTRAMTQQRAARGALSTRSRAQSSAHTSNWESQYYSESAMAARMGFVPEEPEHDDAMHTIDEEATSSATSKSRGGWGRKLPKMRAKSSAHASSSRDDEDDASAAPSKATKGWKLMPKVPFGKGARAKAASAAAAPPSPSESDPIVHDDGRHEF